MLTCNIIMLTCNELYICILSRMLTNCSGQYCHVSDLAFSNDAVESPS